MLDHSHAEGKYIILQRWSAKGQGPIDLPKKEINLNQLQVVNAGRQTILISSMSICHQAVSWHCKVH